MQVIITAKYNAKTEHIASMVREQKNSKSKAAKLRSNYSANYGYNNNNRAFQNNYQQQQYRRPAPQQQHFHHPPQQSFHPPPPNPAQLLSQELCRVRQQQQDQFIAQRRFEESRQIQQSQLDQLKCDLIRQKADLERELKDRLAKELQTRINTELQARIDKEVQVRLEKQLETFKKQHERELKAQAGTLEKLKENLKVKEWQERERAKAKGKKGGSTKGDSTEEDSAKEGSTKEDKTKDSTKEEKTKDSTQEEKSKEDTTKSEPKEQERDRLSREQEMEKDRAPKPRAPAPTRAAQMDKEKIFITIPNDKSGPAMNGHGQNRVQSNGQAKQNGGNPPLRAILGNSASHRPYAPSQVDAEATRFKRTLYPRVPHNGQVRSPAVSVNDRLKLKAPPQTPTPTPLTPPDTPENAKPKASPQAEDVLRVTSSVPKSNSCTPNPRKTVNFKFDPKYDADSLLNMYCAAHGFERPTYTFFGSPPHLHCSVRIEGDVYSSYPEEFVNEETARLRTAEIAIQRIQHAESRKELSVCTVNDEEFIEGLYQELLKYPHGILGHKLEDWYGKTFGHHLPSHWYDLIIESNKIRVEHGINPRIILFANDPGCPEPVRINTPTKMPELALPWHVNADGTTDWNMFISHCSATTEIWAQLIEQMANLEELKLHMSRYMAVPHFRQQVLDPHVQELYLVEVREGWHRVRVISVDAEQRTCRCHFVDFGDVADFSFEELFQCATQFLVLPAQAICLSMYALDKFRDHPHAQRVLKSELEDQTVVARLVTSQSKYFELGGAAQGTVGKGKRQACLSATLYDTSTAEDIHLNDLVASRITKSTPAPTLNDEQNIGKTTPVLVTHITEDGDLMVLLRNDDLKFVERSIATTVADLGEQDRVRYSDLLHDRHVFVCDESAGGLKQWYRGRLVARPENPEEETFDIYYVDDGRQRKTHISNIYRLEANNRALASYPPQALAVRLHDVPEIAGQMLGRLRGLMPSRSEALVGPPPKILRTFSELPISPSPSAQSGSPGRHEASG